MAGRSSAMKIADTFVGMAAKAPNNRARAEILRRGAVTFAGMASDPQVAKSEEAKGVLTHIGLEFAGAAAEAMQRPTTSDFTQLLRDTAQAWDQLGPEAAALTSASMDVAALQPSVNSANNPGVNPGISVAPASWAGANVTLGRSATVTFNPSAEQIKQGILASQTVAFWQGQKQESQAMTIDLTMVAPPTNPTHPHRGGGGGPDQTARPMAVIQYGADGNTQYAVPVDVATGRRITVAANYISVIVGVDPPFNEDPIPITLGASIGMFQAASTAPVVRTVYADDIITANTDSPFFAIPIRASRLLPPLTLLGVAGLSVKITWCSISGKDIAQSVYDYTFPLQSTQNQPVDIPNDAFFFYYRSTVGSQFRFPFQLSL